MAKQEAILVDGSEGEGGGQMLRTSLALSVITQRPLEMIGIRANRSRPGLRPQHRTGLQALARMSGAQLEGDRDSSKEIRFAPSCMPEGDHVVEIGTAGSTALLLHTLYYPMALNPAGGSLRLGGGTHATGAPTYHYLQEVWAPLLKQCGMQVDLELQRYGLFPKGKGKMYAVIPGNQSPQGIHLLERPPVDRLRIVAVAPGLRDHIPQRMVDSAAKRLQSFQLPIEKECLKPRSASPGAICHVFCYYGELCAGFTAFGKRGKPSEEVGDEAAALAETFLRSESTVDERAADQIMLPLVLSGQESSYTTTRLTNHLQTNAQVIQKFLPQIRISFEEQAINKNNTRLLVRIQGQS